MEISRDSEQKVAYISNELQLQIHSITFIHKSKSFPSATSLLSRSPTVYKTAASLGKLSCTDYMDFGTCQSRFGQFSWSKNDSKHLDVKVNVFKKDDKKEFRLVQNLTMGATGYNQCMRLRNQLVIAAENFTREENLSPVLSKDKDEQLKLSQKLVDVVDRTNGKNCVTLLRCYGDKPESSYAQVQLFAREKEDEKFQQIVHVIYKLEEYIYLLDVMNLYMITLLLKNPFLMS